MPWLSWIGWIGSRPWYFWVAALWIASLIWFAYLIHVAPVREDLD